MGTQLRSRPKRCGAEECSDVGSSTYSPLQIAFLKRLPGGAQKPKNCLLEALSGTSWNKKHGRLILPLMSTIG